MNEEDEIMYDDSGNETSGDDVDFAIEVDNTSSKDFPSFEDEYQYEVLSTDEIVKHMLDCIREVNTVVQIPSTITRILLNFFNWDKEKLMEKFFDGNQDDLFREARVVNPFKKINIAKPKVVNKALGTEECEICYMVQPAAQMTGLECGHRFCLQCWNEYLTTKIMEEGVGQTIGCPAHNCPILVDDDTAMGLVRDPRVKLKFQHLITNSFVKCNRLLRWCPSPDCSYAVKVGPFIIYFTKDSIFNQSINSLFMLHAQKCLHKSGNVVKKISTFQFSKSQIQKIGKLEVFLQFHVYQIKFTQHAKKYHILTGFVLV